MKNFANNSRKFFMYKSTVQYQNRDKVFIKKEIQLGIATGEPEPPKFSKLANICHILEIIIAQNYDTN